MMKKMCLLLTLVFAMLSACALADGLDGDELRVQFVPNDTETADLRTDEYVGYIGNLLSLRLGGIAVEVTAAESSDAIIEAMESGEADVGIMPPETYVRARELGAAKVILIAMRGDDDENELPMEGALSDGGISNDVVAVNTRISDFDADIIKQVFLWMGSDSSGLSYLKVWNHSGYVEANEADFDAVAEYMKRNAE